MCAHLQAVALHFSRKTFHRLAPPNLALTRLQSLAITPIHCQLCIASLAAPTHAKKRNAPLTIRSFATPPLLAHAHMHVRRCTLHLQSQSIVPTDHATLVHGFYTPAVCATWSSCSLVSAWCPPPSQLASEEGVVDNHMRP